VEKTEKNKAEFIPESPEIDRGTHSVNNPAVGTAVPPDPEEPVKGFKVPGHKTVTPDSSAACRAPDGPLPRVIPSETVKLLYINGRV
jgi:hypothetical protein